VNTKRSSQTWLAEIFPSIQGEGPLVGVRQLFIRFAGCHRRCRFCDTPAALMVRPRTWQQASSVGCRDRKQKNPVSVQQLATMLGEIRKTAGPFHSLVLTGGEPLLQSDFLCAALPQLRREKWRIYLETAGDHWRELATVLPWLDYVAMDIKLPSVTYESGAWTAHRKFLIQAVASRAETFVKIIVSEAMDVRELRRTARLVAAVAPHVPVILQPATSCHGVRAPTPRQLWHWQALALAIGLHDVRVIPQCHVIMKIR